MQSADLNEMIAFIKNRKALAEPGEYEHFMYQEVLEELYRLQDLEK